MIMAITEIPASATDKWYVCHSGGDKPAVVHLVELPAGSSLGTGQPTVEPFDDEAAATVRAVELGYVIQADEDPA
jgi:hypothetical protein